MVHTSRWAPQCGYNAASQSGILRNPLVAQPIMNRFTVFLERATLVSGAILLSLAGLVWADGAAKSRAAIVDFEWQQAGQRLALSDEAESTLAVLRIDSAEIEVPVFASTGKQALSKGAGHVEGTARPGDNGNIAIAGHRDTFFRGLKDLEVGADIEMATPEGSRVFRVAELRIVDPLDVSVLDPTEDTVLTLITCYPFYYVGPAPDRFIVRAELLQND